MFKDEFSDEELKMYQTIIDSEDYKAIDEDNSEYYYLAKLFEGSGESKEAIAWAYLQASWETDDADARKNALINFKESLRLIDDTDSNAETSKVNHNLIIGELTRLLGSFDEAKAHFEALKADKAYSEVPYILDYINQELKLIDERNSSPALIDQPSK